MGGSGRLAGLGALALGLTTACGARTGLHVYGNSGGDGGVPLQCTQLDAQAERSSLVVFIMLDTSGSMDFKTASGQTKAKAVRDALAQFFKDPDSAGLGVGEAFFPILRAGVPATCTSESDCGVAGACDTKAYGVCWPSGAASCRSKVDCAGTGNSSDKCSPVGACGGDAQQACLVSQPDLFCQPGVACVPLGDCTNRTSCSADEYAKPAVDVGTLPGVRAKLLLGLDTRTSEGATPTLPAIRGAIAAAGAWQDAHAGAKAIVLLATDGLPTTCDPAITPSLTEGTEGIPAVAEAAQGGVADGVQTFVVGVFSPQEQQNAEGALGQIATAGGTEQAFIVTTDSSTVSNQLVATFNDIRNRADVCEYSIPWPKAGGIDPLTLSVSVNGSTIPRVAAASACGAGGGFYFDRDPAPDVLPHRVILCPATCGATPPTAVHMEAPCDAAP